MRVATGEIWKIEDHVCLTCLGRVLSRAGDDGQRVYRCSNCGASGMEPVTSICTCGAQIGQRGGILRCVINSHRSPGFMSEIVVQEAP